jgi:DNA-binding PadR family transcriptional regulator
MDVKTILLGFLIYGSMTGYELKKVFEISFSFFSGLSYGSIYPALKKMEEEGLITMELQVQDGTPNRKVYTITEVGKAAFAEGIKVPVKFERQKHPLLARLFFFSFLPHEDRLTITENYLCSVEKMRKEVEALRPEIPQHADRYQGLCIDFGIRFLSDLEANITWLLENLRVEPATPEDSHCKPTRGVS